MRSAWKRWASPALLVVGLGMAPVRLAWAGAVAPLPEAVKEAGDRFDFGLWDRLLKKYVDGKGRVDYARLRGNAEDRKHLEVLYAQVAAQKIEGLSAAAKKAFLIDAYNVIVWKNVLDNSPKAVNEGLYKFFRRDYIVAGRTMDLDALEKKWIRPELGDARVHMALNCASGGCPILPPEAFTPEKIEAQLDREARRFCNEPRNVSVDGASKKLKLSHIFDWYAGDFGKTPADRLKWIDRYRAAGDKLPEGTDVEYVDYDWHLNDPSLKR